MNELPIHPIPSAVSKMTGKRARHFRVLRSYKTLYLMMLPAIIYYIVYRYVPMYGVVIAFKDYNILEGIVNEKRQKHFILDRLGQQLPPCESHIYPPIPPFLTFKVFQWQYGIPSVKGPLDKGMLIRLGWIGEAP